MSEQYYEVNLNKVSFYLRAAVFVETDNGS